MPNWKAGTCKEKNDYSRELFNLLYTTAYRFCGDHQTAAGLVNKARCEGGGKKEVLPTVKSLYQVFLAEAAVFPRQVDSPVLSIKNFSNKHDIVQDALLQLKPRERAIVVMRDVLDFSYAEIAEVTSTGEKTVAAMLASGRRTLIKFLKREAV